MARIITLGMLLNRLESIYHRSDENGDIPLRLRVTGGSGQLKSFEIDCTTRHLQVGDDGTIIVDVRGGLFDAQEAANG
jgi:hypothetical protein